MKKAFTTISCLTGTASFVLIFLAVTAVVSPAQTFSTLANFDTTNGAYPTASLIQGSDGNFYGTTYGLGTNSFGTVFKMTASGTLTTLYTFCSQSNCTDGSNPYAGLIQAADGNFYGTTTYGGASNAGTVFKITPDGTLTTLYNFCSQSGCTDSGAPFGGLVQGTDGNFYGTTTGVQDGPGTIFVMTPDGTLTTLANVGNGSPYAALIQGADGNFYGTTSQGGVNNGGTVFKMTPDGTGTTLYNFCSQSGCSDGLYPYGGLVQGTDGNFYGTTGGNGGTQGTVFKITPGGSLTTLYSFCSQSGCTDGARAFDGLAKGSDGNFYGTTWSGGAGNGGTVFKITPGGSLTTLYSFCSQNNCTDGASPYAGLVQATDGKFYGTSEQGGTSSNCGGGCGTVFNLDVGLGGGGTVTLSRTTLTFARQVINTTSTAKTITLTNTGTIPLAINNVAIIGDFAVSANTCGSALAVGKKCKISVAFTPTQLGPLTGTLTITDNAANSPQTVALSGSGVLPVTLGPASATYSKRTVGTTSPAKTFTLTNYQTVSLDNIAIGTTGDFAVSTTTCATSLPAKSKCTISVTFTPQATGTRTGQLSVSDSASNSPQTSSLTGTGK